MRRLIQLLALAAVLILPTAVRAQSTISNVGNTQVVRFTGAPTGTCAPNQVAIDNSSNDFYVCDSGTLMWVLVGMGGGGGTILGTIANTQVAFGTAADTIGGDTALIWDSAGNKQTIGTALTLPALANLSTLGANTDALFVQHQVAGGHYGLSTVSQGTAAGNFAIGVGGFGVASGTDGGATGGDFEAYEEPGMGQTVSSGSAGAGVYAAHSNIGAGTTALLTGIKGTAGNISTGTVTKSTAFLGQTNYNIGGGTVTNAYSFYAQPQTVGSTGNYAYFSEGAENWLQSPNFVSCQGLLCLSGDGYGDADGFGSNAVLWIEPASGAGWAEVWHHAGEPASEYWACNIATNGNVGCYGSVDNMSFTGYTINPTTDQFLFDDAGGGATYPIAPRYGTIENCSDPAGAAACGTASAGLVVIDAGATSVVISTTTITANSDVIFQPTTSAQAATRLGIGGCNAAVSPVTESARTAGASVTATIPIAPVTTPMCLYYWFAN